MSPGATSGSTPVSPMSPTLHSGCPFAVFELEAAARPRARWPASAERVAGIAGAVGKRAVGGDSQRQGVAGDQAFDRLRRGPRLILAAAREARHWPARMPASPSQVSAIPIGRSATREDEQQFGGRRQPGEAFGEPSSRSLAIAVDGSAELAEQIGEFVGTVSRSVSS